MLYEISQEYMTKTLGNFVAKIKLIDTFSTFEFSKNSTRMHNLLVFSDFWISQTKLGKPQHAEITIFSSISCD